MNEVNHKITLNQDIYDSITNFGIELYQNERIENPGLEYRGILKLILIKLKKYCNHRGYSFDEYQRYGIDNKIHFGSLAKKKLSKSILATMIVINAEIVELLMSPYSDDSCLKLIELKHGIKLSKTKSNQIKTNREERIIEARINNKNSKDTSSDVELDSKGKKMKPFFINYNQFNINKLSNEERKTIKLIVQRIKTEKITTSNSKKVEKFFLNLPHKGEINQELIDFILLQCS